MKNQLIICTCAFALTVNAQNFQKDLPSENFFSPWCMQRSSLSILPSLSYRFNSTGQLLNSLMQSASDPSELMKNTFNSSNKKNYLFYDLQTSLIDYRKKNNDAEYGFAISFKSSGYMRSEFNLPPLSRNAMRNPDRSQIMKARFRLNANAYAAVSYSFSYLKNVHKSFLKNYGFRIEFLTGLNAVRGQLKSKGLNIIDTNTANLAIERKGFISRSKKKILPEEFLPFHKNPGIAISYGLKWQVSSRDKWAINISNLGFIYYSRTVNNLHEGIDTLDLISETKPFNSYYDSLKLHGSRQNEAYYCLPFEVNANYEHMVNSHHSILFNITVNPLFRNMQTSVSLNKNIHNYHLVPSLNLVNMDRVIFGLGLMKNAKYFSWGLNMNYLSNTLAFYKSVFVQDISIGEKNNFQTSLYVYYNFIRKTKRQTSRHHKLIKTYLRE